jgi:hypothetical protein
MEMEQVESAIYNWPLAPYNNKLEVDANYKRMVEFGMHPENIKAVRLGIASHNLFELAFAAKLAEKRNLTEYFYFEMLEGMADHVRRALSEISGDVLLYAPVAKKEEFINAIAYLIRRLDENTGEENFLRYACNLKTGSSQWNFLKEQFLKSCQYMDKASTKPNRIRKESELFIMGNLPTNLIPIGHWRRIVTGRNPSGKSGKKVPLKIRLIFRLWLPGKKLMKIVKFASVSICHNSTQKKIRRYVSPVMLLPMNRM